MKTSTQSNSSIGTFRRCPREFEFTYERMIEPVGDERETLAVGSAWARGKEVLGIAEINHQPGDAHPLEVAVAEVRRVAPSPLWGEKLARLLVAHDWYWRDDPYKVIRPEVEFEVTLRGRPIRGKADGVVQAPDGRIGLEEDKTTSENLAGDYFDKLRLDPQTSLYALALGANALFSQEEIDEMVGGDQTLPDFILYDVVRKPTIKPKALTKADVARMTKEIAGGGGEGVAVYFGELFNEAQLDQAVTEGKESIRMYGARLTADIGDQPAKYFARREVHRGTADYEATLADLESWLILIETSEREVAYPRNPDSCKVYGTCDYFGLCSNNVYPEVGVIPDGFRCRKHRHPELDFDKPE